MNDTMKNEIILNYILKLKLNYYVLNNLKETYFEDESINEKTFCHVKQNLLFWRPLCVHLYFASI